jgi:hypothetical protein
MRSAILLLSALVFSLAGAPSARAQTSPEAEVRAAIDRLFDGMRRGDSTAVRSVFHPQARLMSVGARAGQPVLRTDSIDAFVRAVGTPHAEVWDERISNVQIQVSGNLASAWMDYSFYRGETFSHCGVNALHFFRDAGSWRVIQVSDTRRREGCPGHRKDRS